LLDHARYTAASTTLSANKPQEQTVIFILSVFNTAG
jgi:hypothetical protein